MKNKQKKAFEMEMAHAWRLLESGDLDGSFRHLERAHVIGQRYVVPHVRSHWMMLLVGARRHSVAQVWGQALRIVLGAFGSAVGVVPIGNTGGTNISMFQRLPIEPGIREVIED